MDDLLAPFRALGVDASFWNHTLDGLAVLGAPGMFRVFRFARPVGELALVADTFHVTPLLRVVQSSDRYQVLCLTRETARVFEGNRDALDELEAGTFPADIDIALGDQRTDAHQTVASYGSGSGGPGPMFPGFFARWLEEGKNKFSAASEGFTNAERVQRIGRVLDESVPKLCAAAKTRGLRSVLVLESNDSALSNVFDVARRSSAPSKDGPNCLIPCSSRRQTAFHFAGGC